MKILIIGEYSGFAKNLKSGFEQNGHEAIIFLDGDGWKKIDVGKNSYSYPFKKNLSIFNKQIRKTWFFNCFKYTPKFHIDKSKFKDYFDVVLIINYEFIRLEYELWLPQFSINDIKYVTKTNARIYLSACGLDYAYLSYSNEFRYSPFTNFRNSPYFSARGLKVFENVKNIISGVIPVMYDYAVSYRAIQDYHNIKILQTIPLPIDTSGFIPSNNIKDKIVVFHGLNTSLKGSEFIIEALESIKLKYPDKVEVIMDGKMPLNDYLKLINKTNIVIDQCFAYSYGMNALYSMAMGKVVFSGNEPECAIEFRVENIPIVNILPDSKDIFEKIEHLIKFPDLIEEYSKQSIEFVNSFHSAKNVALKYIKLFQE